ncbi:Asp-tRNA(Asn)/Glu-tRNA(Gln) amidotransferase subunit GatB [Methanoplanus endosymbiosus]|uniref:Aspartyl/glutamyl-tRNA(Asn/Gln) amidotransferase subunit B n=1 Tax=Methanoplanus endosymbiosus TaxID=33865 RepID=A0A9E7PS72_9EURY|nr:Asp-tRNA(Asn)/Glu-tRNA(Gln) amidotransferase subunit GatB [Methanoplanus endosymbiosus]UUX92692.1 Asp-tRNA(Asn)/Glu-tRNA(Gln) amidotransferase subunit GatB [Methanoplanus endosymbiosus]
MSEAEPVRSPELKKDPKDLKVIIGLEIHCQLKTKTKLFCGCSTDYRDDEPNTHVCPICLGLPGALPKLNKQAVIYALKVAKALNLEIPEYSEFSRKNYFYPDLPKGYQVSQYDKPVAERGIVTVEDDEGHEKPIRITRIHLEEDPGRLVHKTGRDRAGYTLVDYNRSSIPLIEIVTEPDLSSPKEARRFLNKLRSTLEYLDVFDGEREGSIRVDANISLEGHSRVECKNISSYKGVEKALNFEITRQRNMVRRGQEIVMETRHFMESRGITQGSRSKEEECDYRYFPEPDLRPLRVSSWVKDIELPELPDARRQRFIEQYNLSPNHSRTLIGDIKVADFYETVVKPGCDSVLAATWVADTLLGELYYREMKIDSVPVDNFVDLIALLKQNEITDRVGVDVLRIMLDEVKEGKEAEMPSDIVQRLSLGKAGDGEFDDIIAKIVEANPQAVADYHEGKQNALNFLVGQVMKETRGRADPKILNKIMAEKIAPKE